MSSSTTNIETKLVHKKRGGHIPTGCHWALVWPRSKSPVNGGQKNGGKKTHFKTLFFSPEVHSYKWLISIFEKVASELLFGLAEEVASELLFGLAVKCLEIQLFWLKKK